jgi:hypothetical protein
MLAAILMSYQGHEEKNVLAPGTAATILGKYMRLTPPTGLVQRVLKMARAIVIGEAVAELKRMPCYIKRANVLGHQITMKTCKGVEIKKRILDDAKKVHNEKRKRLLEKGKSPGPNFDPDTVDLRMVIDDADYYDGFHAVVSTTLKAASALCNVGYVDAAHCSGSALGTSYREDRLGANRQAWTLAQSHQIGGEAFRTWHEHFSLTLEASKDSDGKSAIDVPEATDIMDGDKGLRKGHQSVYSNRKLFLCARHRGDAIGKRAGSRMRTLYKRLAKQRSLPYLEKLREQLTATAKAAIAERPEKDQFSLLHENQLHGRTNQSVTEGMNSADLRNGIRTAHPLRMLQLILENEKRRYDEYVYACRLSI